MPAHPQTFFTGISGIHPNQEPARGERVFRFIALRALLGESPQSDIENFDVDFGSGDGGPRFRETPQRERTPQAQRRLSVSQTRIARPR